MNVKCKNSRLFLTLWPIASKKSSTKVQTGYCSSEQQQMSTKGTSVHICRDFLFMSLKDCIAEWPDFHSWHVFISFTQYNKLWNCATVGNLWAMWQLVQALHWSQTWPVSDLPPGLCSPCCGEPVCPLLSGWREWHRLLCLWQPLR